MRLSTFLESDSFQIGVIADSPTPAWTPKALEKGIAHSKTGLLIATYPDLDYRKRSIAVTVIDNQDYLTDTEIENYQIIGIYTLKSSHKTIDVGCIPTICDGTSGRLKFDQENITVKVYGDIPFEPKKLLLWFSDVSITNIWANRAALR